MHGFIITSILVTCDSTVSVTKVVVHGRGGVLSHGKNGHPVTDKKNTAPPYITYSIYSLTKVYANGIDMLKNIFLSHIKM